MLCTCVPLCACVSEYVCAALRVKCTGSNMRIPKVHCKLPKGIHMHINIQVTYIHLFMFSYLLFPILLYYFPIAYMPNYELHGFPIVLEVRHLTLG